VRLIAPAVLTIAYPLLILWGLSRFEPRVVALVVLGLLGLRLIGARAGAAGVERSSWKGLWPLAIVAVVVAATAIWNQALGLLMTPVLVNAAMLASFALSLRGQPLVETFARLQVDRLAPAEVRYCRRVTWAWCGFFVANGGISLALALAQDRVAWALYTGGLSYLLMGAFFTGEFVYRHARFRRYVGAFTDPLLARWFPPGHAPEIVAIDGNRDDRARSRRGAARVRDSSRSRASSSSAWFGPGTPSCSSSSGPRVSQRPLSADHGRRATHRRPAPRASSYSAVGTKRSHVGGSCATSRSRPRHCVRARRSPRAPALSPARPSGPIPSR
jgi:uncharacterized membrane protein